MRESQEAHIWEKFGKARAGAAPRVFDVGDGTSIDLAHPCTILGGRNGAGKSRLLRRLSDHLGPQAIFVDLHHLTEQALILYRSRDDFEGMTEEVDAVTLGEDRLNDVQKIIGRSYDEIEWFSLELEIDDPAVADRFRWTGPDSQPLVPFFRATYRGHSYTSAEMGLGEFSVHLLFWILELDREKNRVLILDEPDAYLPPVGVRSLLARLLRLCLTRDWSMVLSTHSEEMIALAVAHRGFTLLEVGQDGQTTAVHSADDPIVATTLLARPPIDTIAFVEDESACAMAKGLLEAVDPVQVRRTSFVWGGGDGYLRELHKHLPRQPKTAVRFTYIFDGDQRGTVDPTKAQRWDSVFLPTDEDPDELMQGVAGEVARIAAKLHVDEARLRLFLAALEGEDPHDWVNKLGEEFGRQRVLSALPAIWAELHPVETRRFMDELRAALTGKTPPSPRSFPIRVGRP